MKKELLKKIEMIAALAEELLPKEGRGLLFSILRKEGFELRSEEEAVKKTGEYLLVVKINNISAEFAVMSETGSGYHYLLQLWESDNWRSWEDF